MIIGIKDSSGSMVDMMHLVDHIQSNNLEAVYLSGREDFFDSALLSGSSGCYTSCAGIFPEVMKGIYDSVNVGDINKARELQRALLPVIRHCFSLPFPIGFKLALEARGFDMGPYWSPMDDATLAKIEAMKPIIEKETAVLVELGENL